MEGALNPLPRPFHPRTIGVVTETYCPEVNGVAMTLGRLVTGLLDRGHEVQLIRPRQNGSEPHNGTPNLTSVLVKAGPLWGYDGLQWGFPAGGRLGRLWDSYRPDAVYVATEGPLGWSAARAARKRSIRVVSGFHTNFHSYSRHYRLGPLKGAILRYLRGFHNATHGTVVPSEDIRDHLVNHGFQRVHVLSRGVDCRLFSPEKRDADLRSSWKLDGEGMAVLYVGRIAAEKNISLAVEAFRSMERRRPGCRFVLVGDGPMRGKLARDNPDFIFAGMRRGEDLARHYASGDIFLFPSETETFGNVTLEAMASGLAGLAYDYAAAGVHVKSGENGVAVPLKDEDAFVLEARRLVEDAGRVERMGRAARLRAEEQGWERIVGRFETLLLHPEGGVKP